jgi:hypothetical protein
MNINPNVVMITWILSVLMAGAIALGPAYIFGVGGALIAFLILSLAVS